MTTTLVGFDLETHCIQPGLLTPPIVCGAVAVPGGGSDLFDRSRILSVARELLCDSTVTLAGANLSFDFGCLCAADASFVPLVFEAYRQGRVWDILIAQALNAIAKGHLFREPNGLPMLSASGRQTERYSLDICVRQCLGRGDAKVNDFWKLRYALLEGIPIPDWPLEARQYPIDDALNAALVAVRQAGLDGKPRYENLQDLPRQVETDWALHLGALWGFRTDEARVNILQARAEELDKEYVARFTALGLYVPKSKRDPSGRMKKDTCAVARRVAQAYGATGVCEVCRGIGRTKPVKAVPCRGAKAKGRYQGCLGAGCTVCVGKGETYVEGSATICKECAGSGFGDLSLVPMTDGNKTFKAALAENDTQLSGERKPTAGGRRVSTSRDTLSESGDEELIEFAENRHQKALKTYVPFLRRGGDRPITLEPNVLVESGRTSYFGVIQLLPRGSLGVTAGEWVPTVRECFKAREGRVLISCDYSAGELCTLSQTCLWVVGKSHMAEIINETKNPGALHSFFAAKMTGEDVGVFEARIKAKDKIAKGFRQAAKPCSFGLPGGMGVAKLVLTNRKEGAGMTEAPDGRKYPGIRFCILVDGKHECGTEKVREWGSKGYSREIPPTCRACLQVVQDQLKPLWFATFPEVKEYHQWVKREIDATGNIVPCFGPWFPQRGVPHRMRDVSDANSTFSAASNNGFQSPIADITKDALRRVTRESYLDESSPLYKARNRIILFAHDELLSECDIEYAHEVGQRTCELMMDAYRAWVPDVFGMVEPTAMIHWSKDAEAVWGPDGRLQVWSPKKT